MIRYQNHSILRTIRYKDQLIPDTMNYIRHLYDVCSTPIRRLLEREIYPHCIVLVGFHERIRV